MRVRPDDRLTVSDPDGGQPAEVTVLDAEGGDDAARARRPRRRARGGAGRGAAERRRRRLPGRAAPTAGSRPTTRARSACSGTDSAAGCVGSRSRPRARRGDRRRARRPGRRGRLAGVRARRRDPAGRAADDARARSSCPRRSPSRGSTSASTAQRARATRSARASTSRSSTSRGRQCSDFLAFHAQKLEQGRRARPRRAGHAHADGPRVPGRRPALEVLRRSTWTRCARSSRTPSAATTRSRSPARASTTRTWATSGHVNCTENFNAAGRPVRDRAAQGLGGAELLLQHRVRRGPRAVPGRALVASGGLRPAARAVRPRLRVLGVPGRHRPGQRLGDHRRPRPRLLPGEPLLDGHRPPRHPGGRARHDQGDGFHSRWSELTRNVTEYRGYWLPTCFTNQGAVQEYWACREKAVVMDLSPLRKWEVLGPDAEALIQATITRDARRLAVGQVVYTAVCNETGGMIDDATVFRHGRRQLPLHRRRPVHRRAPQEGRRASATCACGSSRRRTSCTTSPSRAR